MVCSGGVDLVRVGESALDSIRQTVTANVKELLAAEMPAREAARADRQA